MNLLEENIGEHLCNFVLASYFLDRTQQHKQQKEINT